MLAFGGRATTLPAGIIRYFILPDIGSSGIGVELKTPISTDDI